MLSVILVDFAYYIFLMSLEIATFNTSNFGFVVQRYLERSPDEDFFLASLVLSLYLFWFF